MAGAKDHSVAVCGGFFRPSLLDARPRTPAVATLYFAGGVV